MSLGMWMMEKVWRRRIGVGRRDGRLMSLCEAFKEDIILI